jgi:hypothetical protein
LSAATTTAKEAPKIITKHTHRENNEKLLGELQTKKYPLTEIKM